MFQVVCIGLNHFAGGHFNRISALVGDVSEHAAWDAVDRFRNAVLQHYVNVVKMPSAAEMAATAQRNFLRSGLPGFAYGVDGMIARFESRPRNLPVGDGFPNAQNFFTRKMCYGINVLVIADDRYIIRGIDRDWHGAAHDARIWNHSAMKNIIEQASAQDLFFILPTYIDIYRIQYKKWWCDYITTLYEKSINSTDTFIGANPHRYAKFFFTILLYNQSITHLGNNIGTFLSSRYCIHLPLANTR